MGEVVFYVWLDEGGGLWLVGFEFSGVIIFIFSMFFDFLDFVIYVIDDVGDSFGFQLLSDYGSTVFWGYSSFEILLDGMDLGFWIGIQFCSQMVGGDVFWLDDVMLLWDEGESGDMGEFKFFDDIGVFDDLGELYIDIGDFGLLLDSGMVDLGQDEGGSIDDSGFN